MTSLKGFQQRFSIISKSVCCGFYMKMNVAFTLFSFALLKWNDCLSVPLPFELSIQIPLKHSLVKTISTGVGGGQIMYTTRLLPPPRIFSLSYGPAAASHRHSNWEWNHDLPSKLFEVEKRDFCAPSLKVNPDCCPGSRLHIFATNPCKKRN